MPVAATLVFDLDGTLADTAPDLMAALNFVLTREGVAPLPVAAARRLLGAGGRVADPARLRRSRPRARRGDARTPVRRLSRPLQRPHRRRHDAVSRRRRLPRPLRRRRLAARRLHQQDGAFDQAAARQARRSRPLRLRLRPGHVRRRQARPEAVRRDGPRRRRRSGFRRHGRRFARPTSRPRAPPARR